MMTSYGAEKVWFVRVYTQRNRVQKGACIATIFTGGRNAAFPAHSERSNRSKISTILGRKLALINTTIVEKVALAFLLPSLQILVWQQKFRYLADTLELIKFTIKYFVR